MRAVPPSIDKRNDTQRSLDEAVRRIHKIYGQSLRGFIIVAHDDDLEEPVIAIHTDIVLDDIAEYAQCVIEHKIEDVKESMGG